MSILADFLRRCDKVAETAGWAEATLSTKLLGGGKRLGELKADKDIGIKRLTAALSDLEGLERKYGIEKWWLTPSVTDHAHRTGDEPAASSDPAMALTGTGGAVFSETIESS
ncbi:hypothetical protein [Asticcacaulis sp. AC466]|uniref:hypothetical protein n=1 Tax=Asticcacaulis sp. AC466 TaxID=1282362 RepID=UPI0012DD9A38|nr:hypothetical protein [Asticcacaulis sp. AC466]